MHNRVSSRRINYTITTYFTYLALKGNQSNLHDDVKASFEQLNEQEEVSLTSYEYVEKGHGRLTTRRCDVLTDIDSLEGRKDWLNLSSIIRLQCETTYLMDHQTTTETRYYISSLDRSEKEIESLKIIYIGF